MEINDTPIDPIYLNLRSSSYTRSNDISINKTNLTFDLYQPIKTYENADMYVSLDSFQFTNSFYTINENNSYFCYNINGIVTSVVLTYGNYDIDSLLVLLNSTFITKFIFTYNEITMKITITSIINFKLVDNGLNVNIYELLGFNDIGTSSFSLSCTSPYVVNLISVQQLNITSDLSLMSIGLKGSTHFNIFQTIQVTAKQQEVQQYKNDSMFKFKLGDKVINSITISILNQDYLPINFNNIDWFASIIFTFSYKKQFIPFTNYLSTPDQESQLKYEALREERLRFLEEIQSGNKKNI